MADRFCYLLGAGASFNALPVVKDFPNRLNSFLNSIASWDIEQTEEVEKFKQDIEWLSNVSKKHASIDTYAKKLYLKRDRLNLKKLKAVLSCFFVYEQAKNMVDERYDLFFASVLNLDSSWDVKIPDNICFISWNYDTQLEKAYYGFCENKEKTYKEITFNDKILRLNGYCGTHPPGHLGTGYDIAIGDKQDEIINEMVNLYHEYVSDPQSVDADINFAWENPDITKRNVNEFVNNIKVLIIIGYSFPFFNRSIDKIVLNKLTNLEKIYIQVPEADHQAVIERIDALLNKEVKKIALKDVSAFYIPFEYSEE